MNGENSLDNINFLPTRPGVFPDIYPPLSLSLSYSHILCPAFCHQEMP